MNNTYYIIGAGGHAKVIVESIELCDGIVGGIADTDPNITKLFDYDVASGFPHKKEIEDSFVIIAVGANKIRRTIALNSPYNYGTVIHPSANISSRTVIGPGTVVMAGVSINPGVSISEHCIINTNASIDHDCNIGGFVHISPNVGLAGDVEIGEGAQIGIGASIIQGVKVGMWAIIGAGAVIVHDVPDFAVVVGVPGRIIKYNRINE